MHHITSLFRFIIDAEGQTLGRVASLAAFYIRGKHMPSYTPSMNMGAYGEGRAGKGDLALWAPGAVVMSRRASAARCAAAHVVLCADRRCCRPALLAPAVVIVNAEKVAVTGRKETDKFYFRHTIGRPGGGKMEALRDLRVVRGFLHTSQSIYCCSRAAATRSLHVQHAMAGRGGARRQHTRQRRCPPAAHPPPSVVLPPWFARAPPCILPPPCAQRLPERILEKCVKGMLPKGRIASPLFNHLKVLQAGACTACCMHGWRGCRQQACRPLGCSRPKHRAVFAAGPHAPLATLEHWGGGGGGGGGRVCPPL